jgi:magnesium chelatase subunit D
MEYYPFTAVVGQEEIKKALLVNLICPSIGGVLLSGEKGTAKSSLVRSLSSLLENTDVVTLPLNATEDMITGSLCMEKAIKNGKKVFEGGILERAHGNILYIDEVNLLSDASGAAILDASASGINIVEREGISYKHKAEFILTGSMNPEEGAIKPQLLDRFGLFVNVRAIKEIDLRQEIIKRRLEYEKSPSDFIKRYEENENDLKTRITDARLMLDTVTVSDALYEEAVKKCIEYNIAGHRGDIVLIKTAKALAALAGKICVTSEHIEDAAKLVLPHRKRDIPPPGKAPESPQEEDNDEKDSDGQADKDSSNELPLPPPPKEGNNEGAKDQEEKEEVFEIGTKYEVPDFGKHDGNRRYFNQGAGRRNKVRSLDKKGRYIRYRLPNGEIKDLAFDATLRAAAPFQSIRKKAQGLSFSIIHSDIRDKIREKRAGNTIIFLVDGSGSMGVQKRMSSTKGVIFSLLEKAYQMRDSVGLILFKGEDAQVVLPPTKSLDRAHKMLKELPVGGKTPITHGLYKAVEYVKGLKAKEKETFPIVILLTDGKCNVPCREKDPLKEVITAAEKISYEKIPFVVFDTEIGWARFGFAEKLSKSLNARYFNLDQLCSEKISETVASLIGG